MSWLKWIYIVLSASILVLGQANSTQGRAHQSPLPIYSLTVLFHTCRNHCYLTYKVKKSYVLLKLIGVIKPSIIPTQLYLIARFWSVNTRLISNTLLQKLLIAKATQQK